MYSLLNYDKVSVKGKTVKQEGTCRSVGIRTFTAQMYILIYLELHAGIPDLKVLTLGGCRSFQLIFVPCAIMIMSFPC